MYLLFRSQTDSALAYAQTASPTSSLEMYSDRPLRKSGASAQPIEIECTAGRLPDVMAVGGYYVVSQLFIALLPEKDREQLELVPARVRQSRRASGGAYHALHFLHSVACLDRKHSTFRTDEDGEIVEYKRIRLNMRAIPNDRTFFRMAERSDILIEEKIEAKLRQAGITGYRTIQPEEIDYWF